MCLKNDFSRRLSYYGKEILDSYQTLKIKDKQEVNRVLFHPYDGI